MKENVTKLNGNNSKGEGSIIKSKENKSKVRSVLKINENRSTGERGGLQYEKNKSKGEEIKSNEDGDEKISENNNSKVEEEFVVAEGKTNEKVNSANIKEFELKFKEAECKSPIGNESTKETNMSIERLKITEESLKTALDLKPEVVLKSQSEIKPPLEINLEVDMKSGNNIKSEEMKHGAVMPPSEIKPELEMNPEVKITSSVEVKPQIETKPQTEPQIEIKPSIEILKGELHLAKLELMVAKQELKIAMQEEENHKPKQLKKLNITVANKTPERADTKTLDEKSKLVTKRGLQVLNKNFCGIRQGEMSKDKRFALKPDKVTGKQNHLVQQQSTDQQMKQDSPNLHQNEEDKGESTVNQKKADQVLKQNSFVLKQDHVTKQDSILVKQFSYVVKQDPIISKPDQLISQEIQPPNQISVENMKQNEIKAEEVAKWDSELQVQAVSKDMKMHALELSVSSRSIQEVPPITPVRVSSVASMVCRICQTNTAQECLISPCHCKGSLAYVHLSCLERWLNQSSRSYCELCMFQFNAIQTQRYGLFEGLRLWIRHPRNRNHVQSDLLISILLTIVTFGLIAVCLLGMQYFVIEGKKLGISKSWTKGAISMFLSVIVIGYVTTLYLLVKDQVIPWYNWWKTTVDVRLNLAPSVGTVNTRSFVDNPL